jgi:hypothetical protein
MDESVVFPIYVAVKYIAYSAWCYYGLRRLRNQTSIRSAAGFGLARLGLGIAFGMGIFLAGAFLHLNVPAHPWLLYVSIYAPVRYIEWSILATLLVSGANSAHRIAEGVTQRWIVNGIVVSHLADLPLILFTYEGAKSFLPVGRFLC